MNTKRDGSDLIIPFFIALGVAALYFIIKWITEFI